MKISIITVTFNSESTIRDTIESVLSQDYDNIEYIIVDGYSNDNTLNIIKEYENHIDIIISELDTGIYDAMNKGIALTNGDIIGFLNSDDIFYDSTVVTKIANCFIENPRIDIFYANLVYVDRNNPNKITRFNISTKYYINFFNECNAPPHPTFYVKKIACHENLFFNLNYKIASDYDLMFRLLKVYKLNSYYLDNFIIRMRIGGVSNKNITGLFKQNIEIKKIWLSNNFKLPYFFFIKKVFKKLNDGYKI